MKKFTILTIIICSIFNISCVNAKADFKMVARIINLEEKIRKSQRKILIKIV